ncbi:MAG: cytidylyltransferase domain-containing protein [Brevundimonas sp.]|uniref:acylneuraminate cytidylyltransferase family protein n=1 Tax=Brevundimonas sp. TaxID=1871086 RepID=UPI003919CAB4
MSRSRVLGLIPARGGSKRLPGKNLMKLHGRSLLQRAIDAGHEARGINRLIVSTDDPAIAEAARAGGAEVPFLRPAELATDEASSLDVVRHAMEWADQDEPGAFSHLVLLQPTSPLRTAQDIDQTLALCLERGCSTAISVAPAPKADLLMIGENGMLAPASAFGKPVILNGAVYVVDWRHITVGGGFIAPDTAYYLMDEHRSVDVDLSEDLERAASGLKS